MTRASGMSHTTVSKAVTELGSDSEVVSQARVRREGAGRKRLVDTDPNLLADLDGLGRARDAGRSGVSARCSTLRHRSSLQFSDLVILGGTSRLRHSPAFPCT